MPEKNETPAGREVCRGLVQHSWVLHFPTAIKISESFWIVYRARDCYQVATVGTGSVKMPPSYVVILKGCHNVEDRASTGTGVDGA
jgi:hypothetical protein